ncbi:unnamed protein product [Prorocentrum cordatum]|uniref:Protochlorophyllide reductase n=1 Tax=Prorocentrum cordatum TaxID=2364126 RepID=A0ABN9SP94_9DINO|nr:unnamed protein product [Polarella glacialis]
MWRRAVKTTAVGIPAAAVCGSLWYRETHRPVLPPHRLRDLSESTIVMTGATSGIGKAAAAKFLSLGATVVCGCRDLNRGAAVKNELLDGSKGVSVGQVEFLPLDLSDMESVKQFAHECQRRHSNSIVVIVSAAAEIIYEPGAKTPQGLDRTFATNHLGVQALVAELEPVLLNEATGRAPHCRRRVVLLGSRLETRGSVDPVVVQSSGGAELHQQYAAADPMTRYADSKRCNMLLATALAERWRDRAVDVLSVSPGMVHTSLWRHFPKWYQALTFPIRAIALRSAEEAAEGVVFAAAAEEAGGKSGAYLSDGVEIEPSQGSRDAHLARRLYEECRQLIEKCTR